MKTKQRIQQWILSAAIGLGVAGSASLCLGATSITNNFNASGDMAGWGVNFGTGSVSWNSTAGAEGSGALQIVLDASNPANWEIGPLYTLPTPINSADYVSIEYDLMIDPMSGFNLLGTYGSWQEVLRDVDWSWDSHWVGALGTGYNNWTHMSHTIPNNARNYPRYGFALQSGQNDGTNTVPYSGSVTCYIDNLVFNAFANPLVAGTFTNSAEVGDPWTAGQLATASFSSMDAGSTVPPGSVKVDVAYTDEQPAGWEEGILRRSLSFSPERYTYVAFDLYVENPNNLTGLGICQVFLDNGSGWSICGGAVSVTLGMVGTWTHIELPMPSIPNGLAVIFQFGGGMSAPVTYYVDNVKFYKPTTAPTVAISKAGVPGVQITMNDPGSQWQRDAIASPTIVDQNTPGSVFWAWSSVPVEYSFTIADFPDPVVHEGFEAHMYIVNGDTASTGDQTYGGVDWNAPDIAIVSLQALTNGTFECQFQFKTNRPNNNPLEDPVHRPAYLTSPTAVGTWTLRFTDNTNGTLSGPGGISTNFTIPYETIENGNFFPSTSFIQFGFHKNDNENNGHNNGISGTYSRVKRSGDLNTFNFDDSFNGQTLTNNYAWRRTSASAVQHIPPGAGWFMNWTLPADGFSPKSSGSITGPWVDAGVTNIYQSGAKMYGLIMTNSLPAGDAAYFLLSKPNE